MSAHEPPRWLERVVEWAMPQGLSGQSAVGDLSEEYERRASRSPLRASIWYAGQTTSVLVYRIFTGSGAESTGDDSDLLMDLRWSLRSILRHPGFSFGVIAVLALGLGANTAVYSVVDGTLGKTDWWAEPDRTMEVWPGSGFSYGNVEIYREETTAYRTVGGYLELALALRTPDGESQSVNGVRITPSLFRSLAAQPMLGRAFSDDDAVVGIEPVAIIGEALWKQSFAGDPGIVGKQIDLSGQSVTVVGVQPAGAVAPGGRTSVWIPLVMDPRDDDYFKAQNLTMVAVLRDGAGMRDAAADLVAYTEHLTWLWPSFYPEAWAAGRANVERADAAQRAMISTPLLLLLAGTILLLLVTALNVGNLLLGRAVERRKELAVRASLGAGRGRIVRQLLVEGLVITLLALVAGLVFAINASTWIAGLFVGEAIVSASPILSASVLLFSLGVAGFSWLVVNGVPVAHFLRTQRSGLNVAPDSGATVQRTLVTVQAALATLLLVSATLLLVTVENLRSVPLGFEPDRLVAVELSPPSDRVVDVPAARDLYDRLVERVGALPGVEAVGLTGWLPLRAQAPTAPINLESAPVLVRAESVNAPKHYVDPGFFTTLGIEPLAGRLLNSDDRAMGPSAVVVNETLANRLWPNGNAVGQRIAIDPHAWESWLPVVGVIPDIRSGDITGPIGPAMYVALAEAPTRDITLVVRTSGDPAGVIPVLQRTVSEVDPLVPVRSIDPMQYVARSAYSTSWVMMGLLIVLALLATGLGVLGIYAVLAHHVALTRREIGVRMALGAQPEVVVGGVVRSGLILAGIGIVIGNVAALWSTRFLESLLFEVSALAPWAFILPAVALSLAAALAAWVPAVRAGRLPPAEVLRSD
jgi:predicted permease